MLSVGIMIYVNGHLQNFIQVKTNVGSCIVIHKCSDSRQKNYMRNENTNNINLLLETIKFICYFNMLFYNN